ncbi:c-type cytochrome [Frigidibacter oleivorans]|uniref:c-type cytochrome n=1 Tax=Frigidibacter oleivorans TaxID=2487129 RepID=UPI000F8E1BF0|nr:c-type cytochrome [Frigidibacter oleivorans]
MTRLLRTLVAIAVLAGLVGAAVVFFGLYNTSARSGHWQATNWVLHTTFRNSVRLRAPKAADAPPLTGDMAELGARHYDTACRMCHAAPGAEASATIERMVPVPPPVARAVAHWEPPQLHWIVHEGVKMSGMPGWPAERADEVWAVVAFLDRVPGMTEADYAALTARPGPPPETAEEAAFAYCASCHGTEGRPGNAAIPRLDILGADYLARAVEDYRSGRRPSGIMQQALSVVPEEVLPAVLARFAAVPPVGAAAEPGPGADRGAALARAETGNPEVPACVACHGPVPEGLPAPPPGVPRIAGQSPDYLESQLRLWRDGWRGGGPRAGLMRQAAQGLNDDQIADLADWFASLDPAPR